MPACPVCGAVYMYHDDNRWFTCPRGHTWEESA